MSTEITRAVLDHHMQSLNNADLDATMADYAEDCVYISGETILRGPDALRGPFGAVPAGAVDQMAMQHSVCEGDVAYIVWSMANGMKGTDTFIVRDGRIVVQTVCLVMP